MDMTTVSPPGQEPQQRPPLPEMPPAPPAAPAHPPDTAEPAPLPLNEAIAETEPTRTSRRQLFRKAAAEPVARDPGIEPRADSAQSTNRADARNPAQTAPAEAPSGPVPSTQCDQTPAILEVEWPRRLRRTFQGTVTIRVEILADGKARSVELVRGTGRADLDRQLTEAMSAATYRAGVKDGRPVACVHQFRIQFATE